MTPNEAAGALRAAGWPRALWPVMIAIGKAESGLRVDAVSPVNRNGTRDLGWLQISKHGPPFDPRLTTDAVFTAKQGLSIWQRQGLNAWTVYKTGAYRKFIPLGQQGAAAPVAPPKAGAAGKSDDSSTLDKIGDAGKAVAGAIAGAVPGAGLVGGVKDTGEAVVAAVQLMVRAQIWIANPHNWLRVVEVAGGAAGVLIALRMLAAGGVGGPVGAVAGGLSKVENAAGTVASVAVPVAKVAKVAKATKAAGAAKAVKAAT